MADCEDLSVYKRLKTYTQCEMFILKRKSMDNWGGGGGGGS